MEAGVSVEGPRHTIRPPAVTVGGIGAAPRLNTTAVKTSAYTATANQLVPVNAAGGAVTITLPSASAAGIGAVVVVQKTDTSVNTVTVTRAGSNTINTAATTATISLADEALTFTSDGVSRWTISAGQTSLSSLDGRYASIGPVSTKTAAYTLTASDSTILVDATSGALTMTLPTSVGLTGRSFTIKRINGGGNAVAVAPTSGQTIDGVGTYILGTPQASVEVQSDGANWRVVRRRATATSVVNVVDFGAKGDNTGDDSVAIQAAIDSLPTSGTFLGGTVYFPRGIYRTTSPITLKSNVRLVGDGSRASRINVASGAGLFTWTAALSKVAIADLYLSGASGHLFAPTGDFGISLTTITGCTVVQSDVNSSILAYTGSSDYDNVNWLECDLQMAAGATVPAFRIVNSGGAANENRWENCWAHNNGASTAPFFYIESTAASSYAYGNVWRSVTFEQNPGGLIHLFNNFSPVIESCSAYDTTTYTADLIKLTNSASATSLRTRYATIRNFGRRGGALAGGVYDINLVSGASAKCTVYSANHSSEPTSGLRINFDETDSHTLVAVPSAGPVWPTQPTDVATIFGSAVKFGRGSMVTTAAKTAAYTLTSLDSFVTADASSAAFTVTLPTAVGIAGRAFTIKRINGGSNAVTVATTSSQTIDGATTYTLGNPKSAVEMISDGANWRVAGRRATTMDVVNVMDFGATGDGTADDTVAIQAAITVAVAAGTATSGRTVFFPAGQYKITATLLADLAKGVHLVGAGRNATVLLPSAALAGLPVIKLQDYYHCGVTDMTIQGTTGSEPSAAILSWRERNNGVVPGMICQKMHVRAVHMTAVQRGIQWANSGSGADGNNDQSTVTNCYVGVFTVAAYDIAGVNSVWHRFNGGEIVSGPIAWRMASGSFTAQGTVLGALSDVEVDVTAGTYIHPTALIGVGSEDAGSGCKILRTAAVAGFNIKYLGYERTQSAATKTMIDFAATTYSSFTMTASHADLGQTGQVVQFTDATSTARFIDCSGLGFTSISYNGVLRLSGNRFIAGTVTLTDLGSGTLVESGNTGGGFTARALAGTCDTQVYTATGTWTKPASAKAHQIALIAGGSGGGSGRKGAAGTVCGGGGGGGGGQYIQVSLPSSALPSSATVTVGAAGTGGAAVTANSTNGNNGTAGIATTFGSVMRANGSLPGAGGTTSGGAGGAVIGASGAGAAGGTGAAGGAISNMGNGCGGGAGGGGISSGNAAFNGGTYGYYSITSPYTGGSAGVVDTTAPTGGTSAPVGTVLPGHGGGGGASSVTTNAQAGADGGRYGGGGGGGGASRDDTGNSGAGGNGAQGAGQVITWF